MDEKQLKGVTELLHRMRREVLQEVQNSLAATLEYGLDGVPDIGDMSAATYHRDVLLNLSETQRQKVRDIDAALERLEAGQYGICQRCEEPIPLRRLEVRPFSRYCVECKSEIEKFGE